jgi:hypothetical protein
VGSDDGTLARSSCRKDGKQMPAGRAIRDKREDELLAATMRDALRG